MNLLINKFFIAFVILPIVASVGGYLYLNRDLDPNYESIVVRRGVLIQEVSVTGRVQSPASVDLAFEKAGKIAIINVSVGDTVRKGQLLARLSNSSLSAQLLQAQANLGVETATLADLKQGARVEEIQLARTKVANAELALADDQLNVINVQNKAAATLREDYRAALTATADALDVARNALVIAGDMRRAYFSSSSQDGITIISAITAAENDIEDMAALDVAVASSDGSDQNIAISLVSTLSALASTKDALAAIPIFQGMGATDKASINTQKDNVNNITTTISASGQAIAVQKVTNASNIAAAAATVNDAQSALLAARDDLALKEAGATPEKIVAQVARMAAAEANIQNIRAQLTHTVIYSPLNGIVTRQDPRVGEIISTTTKIVSLISDADLEIQTYIPEADIAKVSIGDMASVTLDAYGSDEIFPARVAAIDPAETILEGVSTYKVTLQFVSRDERIKTGMTANIDILTAQLNDVIVVPIRSVITRNGDKFVRVVENGVSREVGVITGVRGSDGNIEIVGGLVEGDEVITFMRER